MKTPEQIAAETAEKIVPILVNDSYLSYREDAAKLILAALTEHAAQIERERDGWRETAERYAKNDLDGQAELTALRAVADEMEKALKDFSAIMSESLGIAGYHLNGDVYTWDEGDDPLRDKADAALTRYAAQPAANTGDNHRTEGRS